jgi:hypothetical protein
MLNFRFITLITALIAILTSGCGKQGNPTQRTRIIQRTGQTTGAPNHIEYQAQNLGINVNWEETVVLKDDGYQLELEHVISVNGNRQSIHGIVPLGVGSCDQVEQITYDVFMGKVVDDTVYTSIAVATCWMGNNLHLGFNVMAWNTQGLTQQFVLVDFSQALMKSIQKKLFQQNQGDYLPNWMARQFLQ